MNPSVAIVAVLCLTAVSGAVLPDDHEHQCLSSDQMMPGGARCMSDSELQSDEVKNYAKESIKKYKEQKESANQLHKCEEMAAEVQQGSTQVVAGTIYRFKIKVTSNKKDTDECTNEDFTTKEATCKVKIFKPLFEDQETEYSVLCVENTPETTTESTE